MTPVAQKTDKPPKKGSLVCKTHLEEKQNRKPGQTRGSCEVTDGQEHVSDGGSACASQPNGTGVVALPKERWAANSHLINNWLLYGLIFLVRW